MLRCEGTLPVWLFLDSLDDIQWDGLWKKNQKLRKEGYPYYSRKIIDPGENVVRVYAVGSLLVAEVWL